MRAEIRVSEVNNYNWLLSVDVIRSFVSITWQLSKFRFYSPKRDCEIEILFWLEKNSKYFGQP